MSFGLGAELPYRKYAQQVASNNNVWNRETGEIQDAAAAQKAAATAAANNQGAADLTSLLTPYGAPVSQLLPAWQKVADKSGLTLEDFANGARDYFAQITSPDNNSRWWGGDAWFRVPLQGAGLTHPDFDWGSVVKDDGEAAQQKQIGDQLTAEQQTHGGGDDWLGIVLGVVGIAAAVFTGGASLGLTAAAEGGTAAAVGAGVGEAAFAGAVSTAGAGIASTAAFGAADVGLAGLAGSAVEGAALGGTAEAASGGLSVLDGLNYAKQAYGAVNTVTKLTGGNTPPPQQGAIRMANANPLFAGSGVTTDSTVQQGASPATVGATAPVSALSLPFGLSMQQVAMLAVLGLAVYAYYESK